MPQYHFSLRNHDGSTLVERSLVEADLSAAWSMVREIARQARNEKEASRILVRNDEGEVVILVGIATARVLAASDKSSLS